MKYISPRFFPQLLIQELKENGLSVVFGLFECAETDETWVRSYDPETKHRHHSGNLLPCHKKSMPSTEKNQ